MGIFGQFKYENYGTEIDFAQGFFDAIKAIDERITIEDTEGNPTTAAIQYADRSSSARATFVVNLGHGAKLTFPRRYTNNQSDCVLGIVFTGRDQPIDGNQKRWGSVAYYKSEDLLILWFAGMDTAIPSGAGMSVMQLKKSDDSGYIYSTTNPGATILNATFSDGVASMTYAPILSYNAGAGKIDYAEKVCFISAGAKFLDTEAIKSCSTVAQFSSIALPDGRIFYTIGTNAMVQVEPTT